MAIYQCIYVHIFIKVRGVHFYHILYEIYRNIRLSFVYKKKYSDKIIQIN